jgi:hypothetical protein
MTLSPPNSTTDSPPDAFRWRRDATIQVRHDFQHPDREVVSQRQFAHQTGVPRSTLQHWLRQTRHPDLEPELVAFFECPAGFVPPSGFALPSPLSSSVIRLSVLPSENWDMSEFWLRRLPRLTGWTSSSCKTEVQGSLRTPVLP